MDVLVIEDEMLAAERLVKVLLEINPDIDVIAQIDTVKEASSFIEQRGGEIDLILCDIHLADGSSFEIFEQQATDTPVIFVTAFQDYSLDAFRVNAIDYLLKPIKKIEVERALTKYEKYFHQKSTFVTFKDLQQALQERDQHPPNRFLVKSGAKFVPKKVNEIVAFFVENRIVHLIDYPDKKRFLIDFTLEELIKTHLPKDSFFRINRKQIVNIDFIEAIRPHSNQRLSVEMKFPVSFPLIVSREKVNDFKSWFVK